MNRGNFEKTVFVQLYSREYKKKVQNSGFRIKNMNKRSL